MIPFKHRSVRVKKAEPLEDYRAYLIFDDGLEGEVDLAEFIFDQKGLFEALKETNYFKKMSVDETTICWPNEVDLAPDTLYWKVQNGNKYLFRDLEPHQSKNRL